MIGITSEIVDCNPRGLSKVKSKLPPIFSIIGSFSFIVVRTYGEFGVAAIKNPPIKSLMMTSEGVLFEVESSVLEAVHCPIARFGI